MVRGGKDRIDGTLNVQRVDELTWHSTAEAQPLLNTRTRKSHFPHHPCLIPLVVSHLSCMHQTSHFTHSIYYLYVSTSIEK